MSRRTKKVGPAGRLGARYGVRIRKRITDVEVESKGRHDCPKCKARALVRKANGIWECRKCGAKLASSSYMPTPKVAVRREVAEVLAEAEEKERPAEDEEEEPRPEKKAKKE
ncbi:MAG: 50S ribosomal protein L37ae [Candidatus Thermoplasmatota archaeon]|nr:50S ribosomal protein L37ae [Candidatus Thermoplasmatota archaeon]